MPRDLVRTTPRMGVFLTVATLLASVFSVFPAWPAHGAAPQPEKANAAGRDIGNVNVQACRELREAIGKRYSYRDMRGVNWDQLFRQDTPGLLAASGPGEFAAKTAALLANAKDAHISVEAEGWGRRSTFRVDTTPNCNNTLLDRVVPNLRRHNAMVATGRFPDGTCFEGQGIDPDVRVVARPADFQKRDPVIDAALCVLRKAAGEKSAKP